MVGQKRLMHKQKPILANSGVRSSPSPHKKRAPPEGMIFPQVNKVRQGQQADIVNPMNEMEQFEQMNQAIEQRIQIDQTSQVEQMSEIDLGSQVEQVGNEGQPQKQKEQRSKIIQFFRI